MIKNKKKILKKLKKKNIIQEKFKKIFNKNIFFQLNKIIINKLI